MPLIGYFCAAILAHSLCVAPVAHTAAPAPPMAIGTTAVIFRNGQPAGVYIDNEELDPCAVVTSDRAAGWQLVVLGVTPGTPRVRCAGALNAQEWYPYDSGERPSSWGPMPAATAYILQRTFSFTGQPPNRNEQARLLRDALRHHPRLILWY